MKYLAIAALLSLTFAGTASAFQYNESASGGAGVYGLGAGTSTGASTSGLSGAASAGNGIAGSQTESGVFSEGFGSAKYSGSAGNPTITTNSGNLTEGYSNSGAASLGSALGAGGCGWEKDG